MSNSIRNSALRSINPTSLDADVVTAFAWNLPEEGFVDREDLQEGLTVAICTYMRADAVERFIASLRDHDSKPVRLVVVDASPDDSTQILFEELESPQQLCDSLLYVRVTGGLKGLTRQRNFSLRLIDTDTLVFFDDDIVLEPGALRELVEVMRIHPDAVGIGAFCINERTKPSIFWRIRAALRIVPSLQPGDYSSAGFSIPWGFAESSTERTVEGKWLKGCSMMWRTATARSVRFNDDFAGYSSGEDLDFSLRMGRHGKLFMAIQARVNHLPEVHGRPNAYQLGYMSLHNSHDIHRRCLQDRTWRDAAKFVYSFGLDSALRIAYLPIGGDRGQRIRFLSGRLRYFGEMLLGALQPAKHEPSTDGR